MSRPNAAKPVATPTAKAGARASDAKRQKVRECGAKWQEEKKANGLSGKAAYLKFLSACLKSCEGLDCLFDDEE